jgi:hypothetical protein
MEERLAEMVTKGVVYARIDRIEGLVRFQKPQEPADVLNQWANDISKLLGDVEETCHLIRCVLNPKIFDFPPFYARFVCLFIYLTNF